MNGNAGGERQENVRAGDFWLKDALCNVIHACYRLLLAIIVQLPLFLMTYLFSKFGNMMPAAPRASRSFRTRTG